MKQDRNQDINFALSRSHGGRVVVGFATLSVQVVIITTDIASSNPADGEVYLMQNYVIKFVSNLQQVGGFLLVLWFPPPIILTATIFKILLKVALNTLTLH